MHHGTRDLTRPRERTLVDLLRTRAAEEPDRLQYRFVDGDRRVDVTVRAVLLAAETAARHLRRSHEPGARVVVLLPSGQPFVLGFFGTMIAGLVPVPVAPPGRARLGQALDPLRRIVDDATPVAVITTAKIRDLVLGAIDDGDRLHRLSWHAVEDLASGDDGPVGPRDDPSPGDVAYVQYTSGSTSEPKGVVLTHAAVVANLRSIHTAFGNRAEDHGMIWLPPHHDMGLLGGILAPLGSGIPVTLGSPNRFVQSPANWLRWISDNGATISGGPDFAYRLCVDRIRDDQLEGIDLGRWRLAFTGAEPISARTLEAFTERFAPLGFEETTFYPCFGLAEATLMVTGGDHRAAPIVRSVSRTALHTDGVAAAPQGDDDRRDFVGCGMPISADDVVAIVDPDDRRPVPPGTVGEIWYQGPSVGIGYHGDATRSASAFDAHTADGEGPFLRTGDLGFVLDGQLHVTGRRKDVVVVRGRNLDAHDIEEAVTAVVDEPRMGMTAALSATGDGHERLVIVQELGRTPTERATAIAEDIQRAVAQRFEVRADDVVLARTGSLPRTTSGKLRRAEAVRLYEDGAIEPASTGS